MDRVLQRRDTAANWSTTNPILAEGEIGIITDGAKGYKIGDGVTRWNALEYPANPTNVVGELGDSEVAVINQKTVTDSLVQLEANTVTSIKNSQYIGKPTGINMLNYLTSVDGYLDLNVDGEVIITDATHKTSDFIAVEQGVTYSFFNSLYSFYGNVNGIRINAYRQNKAWLTRLVATYDSTTQVSTFYIDASSTTLAQVKYVRISYAIDAEYSTMLVKGDYPSEIITYTLDEHIQTSSKQLSDKISYTQVDFLNVDESINLFNPLNITIGKYVELNVDGLKLSDNATMCTSNYIPVIANQYYCFKPAIQFYGSTNSKKVLAFDRNKSFLTRYTGTLNDDVLVFKATYTGYVLVSFKISVLDEFMFVIGDQYPDSYIEPNKVTINEDIITIPSEHGKMDNVLFRKNALYLGDSIGEGLTANDNKYGWSGRIAENNEGTYYSLARSGATFTKGLVTDDGTPVTSILTKLEELITGSYTGDYIIVEGGTNDADRIGSILNGTSPEKFGVWSELDFSGNYDEQTFCGAFESLIYKILLNYKDKKFGIIIAQKMGYAYDTTFLNRRAYFDEMIKICRKWGVPYIDLWNTSWLNPRLPFQYDPNLDSAGNTSAGNYYVDGQHLTGKAYDYLARIIAEWMRQL